MTVDGMRIHFFPKMILLDWTLGQRAICAFRKSLRLYAKRVIELPPAEPISIHQGQPTMAATLIRASSFSRASTFFDRSKAISKAHEPSRTQKWRAITFTGSTIFPNRLRENQ